jgi:putative cell wall-binding protein
MPEEHFRAFSLASMGARVSHLKYGHLTIGRSSRRRRRRILGSAVAFVLAIGAPLATAGPATAAPETGSISGNVKAADSPNRDMADASVLITTADGQYAGATLTDAAGAYTIDGLAPGSYFIEFSNYGGGVHDQAYLPQWWENATTPADATTTTVVAGVDAGGRDAVLVPGARITGHVTDSAGAPLDDIYVPVWQQVGTSWELVAEERTYGGDYWITPLPVGTYKVGFADGEDQPENLVGKLYNPQYYTRKSSLASADTITIRSAGETVSNTTVKLAKKGTTTAPVVERFSGANRYLTAVDISKKSFGPGVPVVYVATGAGFPDALAAAPAAAAKGGPLLLTATTALPTAVLKEIERLEPLEIVVVGGTGVVSASVYNQLKSLTPEIRRDAGADRYDTSRMIVERAFPDGSATAIVATGGDFPDALAAAAAAGSINAPVVLVNGAATSVDAQTKAQLSTLKVKKAIIAGGTGVVSTRLESSLKSILGATNVTRHGGADRYNTSLLINQASFSQSDTVYLSNGKNFADALAGAAVAGKNKAPLYAVYTKCLPKPVLADIKRLGASTVVLLGGTGVLTNTVAQLRGCL